MAFSSRVMLANSVIGVLAAGSTAVLTLAPPSAYAAVKVPDFDTHAAAPTPVGATGAPAIVPPVTGAQIAGLVLTPARDRVNAIIAERAQAAAAAQAKAEAARAAADREQDDHQADSRAGADRGDETFRRWAAQFRQACDSGRLHGEICTR
ncbi:hypothetical protein ACQPZQ_04900 [Pseudonocardia sp. CA-142604]|uniref:hypothetical protein n=1 Tax=Pseudonocardia sp. CA-142604 TaxID=3240024 RepID=UPI003D8F5A34